MTRKLRTPRGAVVLVAVRMPDAHETPLSDAEVWHGLQADLLDVVPLPRAVE